MKTIEQQDSRKNQKYTSDQNKINLTTVDINKLKSLVKKIRD